LSTYKGAGELGGVVRPLEKKEKNPPTRVTKKNKGPLRREIVENGRETKQKKSKSGTGRK